MEKTMDKIVALAKSRGFVYPGSEIYGGLANTWDYGNLGVELKNNVKRAWWQKFIQENPYNVGVDCAILMNPQTWVASGHLGGFSDPLMDCKEHHFRMMDFCKKGRSIRSCGHPHSPRKRCILLWRKLLQRTVQVIDCQGIDRDDVILWFRQELPLKMPLIRMI